MNIGTTILALRKKHSITQEALAAELGVTAAAVSKWEKGYTLPDILMLCALADYFKVTTDELLGRTSAKKQAIVVAKTEELGRKLAELAATYGIETKMILTDYAAALEVEAADPDLRYMFTAMDHPLEEHDEDNNSHVIHVDVQMASGADEDVLNGIEVYLKNMDAIKNITDVTANWKK